MAPEVRRLNMCTYLTNGKLPFIHCLSVPRSKSKADAFNYAEIGKRDTNFYKESCYRCAKLSIH